MTATTVGRPSFVDGIAGHGRARVRTLSSRHGPALTRAGDQILVVIALAGDAGALADLLVDEVAPPIDMGTCTVRLMEAPVSINFSS